MIPGAIAVLIIIAFIKEKKRAAIAPAERPQLTLKHFDWKVKFLIVIATLFALGNWASTNGTIGKSLCSYRADGPESRYPEGTVR